MIKVTLLFGAILVLSTAAIQKTSEQPQLVDGCKSDSEMWSSVDGTKFNFCVGKNKSLEQSCPPNTFFVQNATVTGCLPFKDVEDNCVCHAKPQECKGAQMSQPQAHENPTQFYLCYKDGADPAVMNCTDGAFVDQDGWLGCVSWALWRIIRGCYSSK